MSDTSLNKIIQYGTDAERLAFTPAPASGSQILYIWYTTDTGITYVWDGAVWVQISGAGAAAINISASATSLNLTNLVFSNSNGVTFGLSASTITASHNGISGVNLSAGTTSNNLTNWVLSNSNNVTFGLSGSTVTATAAFTQTSAPASLLISAGTQTNDVSAIVFSNSNNVSFGLDGSTITATVTIATSLTNVNISASNASANLSNFVFSNSNGVSFGLNGSTITGSVAAAIANINVSAGTTSNNLTNVVFSNSNNVTFGLDGSTVTASAAAAAGGATWNHFANLNGVQFDLGTQGQDSRLLITPFFLPVALSGSYLRYIFSVQSNQNRTFSGTSANTSWSASHGMTLANQLFTRGEGASSESFFSVSNFSAFYTIRTQFTAGTAGSQYTVSIQGTLPFQGGQTNFEDTYNCSSASYVINPAAFGLSFGSNRFVEVAFNTSIPAGNYWLGFGKSSTTSLGAGGAAGLSTTNWNGVVAAASVLASPIVSRYGVALNNPNLYFGLGQLSTNSQIQSTSGFSASQVTATGAGNANYVPFWVL